MCLDANKDMTHNEMKQLIWRKAALFADEAKVEYKLPNGKIADVYYVVKGVRFIIEVKTSLKQSYFWSAYQKYASQCDYLVLAVPQGAAYDSGLDQASAWQPAYMTDIGLWLVTWLGIDEVRPVTDLRKRAPARGGCQARAMPTSTAIAAPGCTVRKP